MTKCLAIAITLLSTGAVAVAQTAKLPVPIEYLRHDGRPGARIWHHPHVQDLQLVDR